MTTNSNRIKGAAQTAPGTYMVIQEMAGPKLLPRQVEKIILHKFGIHTDLAELHPDTERGIRIYTLIKR